jgi:hypothetical protein
VIPPGSRYEDADKQFALAHIYNEWGYPLAEGEPPNYIVRTANRETTYRLQSTSLPAVQPFDYFVKDSEHIAFLGYKFLGDAKRWWEIADANPKVWYPLDLKMGDFIVIPV